MDAALVTLDRTLRRARSRLRFRRILRAAAVGFQVGLGAAIPAATAVRLLGLARWEALAIAGVVVGIAVAVGGLVGGVRPGLDRRSLALLVDRLGATDELVLTAVHVTELHAAGTDDPNRDRILARLGSAPLPDPRVLLPLSRPRHLRWAAVPVGLLLATVLLVRPVLSLPWRAAPSPVAREGQRLEERVAGMRGGVELPEPLEQQVEDLGDALRGDDLSPEEARRRIEELQQQLAAFREDLAPSSELLHDLETAARALDAASTEALAEGLRAGDLEAAAGAANDLSESLSEASPAERARAAEALDAAGRSLEGSSDPRLQRAGESLRRAGQEGGAPLDPATAAELARDLAEAGELGEQLQQDAEALQRSQELNGALEGARQRLGGSPQMAQGASSDAPGEGGLGSEARGPGTPGAPEGQGDGSGSEGHTWEEQGPRTASEVSPEDRQSARTGGTQIDDFQRLYDGLRLEGAESLLAGTEGTIDPTGRVDRLPIRITGGEADARAPTVILPARYRDQAVEAIGAEPIPPAYEQVVKTYFDAMD